MMPSVLVDREAYVYRVVLDIWQLHDTIQLPDAEAAFFFYGTEAVCGME
jgi:hypothetical protein